MIETYVFWNYHEPVRGEVRCYVDCSDFNCNSLGYSKQILFEFAEPMSLVAVCSFEIFVTWFVVFLEPESICGLTG